MGFKHKETAKKWVFFLVESSRYAKYLETKPDIRE